MDFTVRLALADSMLDRQEWLHSARSSPATSRCTRKNVTVGRLKRQGAEEEQVQRALRKINGSRCITFHLWLLQEGTNAAIEVQKNKRRRETGIPQRI
jgi:hypothetical protein